MEDEAEDEGRGDPPENGHLKHPADELSQQPLRPGPGTERYTGRPGHDDGKAESEAGYSEQRPQCDNERRNRRADHQYSVDQAYGAAKREGRQNADEDRCMKMPRN